MSRATGALGVLAGAYFAADLLGIPHGVVRLVRELGRLTGVL